jgi:hypothetical protein
MERFLSILGTLASLGSIPISIYIYLKSKEETFAKVKKEIVKILSYQIGEDRELTTFEIQTVINSKLRENRFKANSITVVEIVEDLVSETISSPMIDRSRKKMILNSLRNVYIKGEIFYKIDALEVVNDEPGNAWESIQPKIKSIIESKNELDNTIKITEEGYNKTGDISTIFAVTVLAAGIFVSVVWFFGADKINEVFEPISHNRDIRSLLVGLTIGLISSIIAGILVVMFGKIKAINRRKSS